MPRGSGLTVSRASPGAGPVDHIAFNASDYEALRARARAPRRRRRSATRSPTADRASCSSRIPNGVRIEINVKTQRFPKRGRAMSATETTTAGRRTTPPFRADHVGSLLRPPELMRAREEFAAGRISADELRAVEDEADPRRRQDAGGRRAPVGDRRRVPPRDLAHGLHLPARRGRAAAPGGHHGPVPQRRRRHRVQAGVDPHRREDPRSSTRSSGTTSNSWTRLATARPRRSSRSRRRAWSTTAAARR